MPWSAWQDAFEVRSSATTRQLRYNSGAGGVIIASDDLESSFFWDGIAYSYRIIGYQYQRPPNWATFRTFPYPMFDLVEGVDYIEVPDQPGVYYEYEDEPNTFVRWDVPPVVLSVNHDPPAARAFQMRMELDTTYIVGETLVFDADRGAGIGGWNGLTPEGTVIATPNPGNALSFSLWPSLPQPFDFGEPNGYQEYLTYITVWVYTRLPRWRYWTPRDRYAQLLHRGDGNGMSARRLVNGTHTRQTGRLRGAF